jgi:glycosyltransferase involved in cell wall biosynthesis
LVSGLPCVATAVGDCAELLSGGGWIVDPGNVESLADALDQACEQLTKWDRQIQREIMSNRFDANVMANTTLKLIDKHMRRS